MNKKTTNYLLSFIIPILILLVGYIFIGIYPLGEKSILISDMREQYIEFYGKFYDILRNGNLKEIIYSWNAGLGDSFLTLMMYYLMSPLSYIILLFPKNNLPEFLLFITLTKMGLCGLSFNYLLSFLFKNKDKIYKLAFSTMYALIGYNITYSFHIMWLDGVYLLPLVIVGVEKIVREKKWRTFCITILLGFITNFYISYMIGLYSLIYFVIQILLKYEIKQYKEIKRCFILFILSTFLAASILGVFLIPTFLEVLGNNSNGIKLSYNLNSFIFQIGQLINQFFINSNSVNSFVYIYCGVIVIPLIIIYFLNKSIDKKEKVLYGLLCAFLIISFIEPFLNLLWHAFDTPTGFPNRFSFLLSFTILLMSYKALINIKNCKKSLNFIWITSIFIVCIQLIINLIFQKLLSSGGVTSIRSFILTLIFLIIYYLLFKNSIRNKKYFNYIICGIVLIELLMNSTSILLKNRLNYVNRDEYGIDSTIDLINTIKEDISEFYRIDNNIEKTRNESLRLGYSGISYFSSMSNIKLNKFLLDMGLSGFELGVSTKWNSPFLNSILDVKYTLTSNSEIVENNVLPLAFQVNKNILSYKSIKDEPFENQINLFQSIIESDSSDEKLYSLVDFEIESKENLFYENNTYVKLDITKPGYLNLKLNENNREDIFLQIDTSNEVKIIIDNEVLDYKSWDNAMNICKNKLERISIEINDSITNINNIKIYSLNREILDKHIEDLKEQTPSKIIVNNNKVLIKGIFKEDEILFTSIPFEKGWKAKIDGEAIDIEALEEALILIDVPGGEHEIELYYLPEGFLLGGVVSIIGIVLFMLANSYTKNNKHSKD